MTTATTPRRKLSLVRLSIVLVGAALIALVGTIVVMDQVEDTSAEETTHWFAPYVDVTLLPTLHFEDAETHPAADVVLGFVVADPADPCKPSWGSYYSLDAAARALDLDRRIVRLRERGDDAIVSFGGAANQELAVGCTRESRLIEAYQTVIDRYDLAVVDFDIEGSALADHEANVRRAEAIARLQEENPGLKVWFTLPVAPFGLTPEGVQLVDAALAAGVRLDGVNVMTMNYGDSRPADVSMHEATVSALLATWQQLDGAFVRAGSRPSESEIWNLIGATPMIGQNDIPSDVFDTDDARRLTDYGRLVGLGRISMWSANRDIACGGSGEEVRVSNTCSGVEQDELEFTNIFLAAAQRPAEPPEDSPNQAGVTDEDPREANARRNDPRTNPYPLWRAARVYEEEDKVVWEGRVYQAKWWSQGDQPDAPVENVWDTPWRYLGPVLDSDRAAVIESQPAPGGPRPGWSGETVYVAGNEVEHDGEIFEAKWWTQGNEPQADPDQPYDHPWEYLGEAPPITD